MYKNTNRSINLGRQAVGVIASHYANTGRVEVDNSLYQKANVIRFFLVCRNDEMKLTMMVFVCWPADSRDQL